VVVVSSDGDVTVFFYARLWRRSNVLTISVLRAALLGKAASFVALSRRVPRAGLQLRDHAPVNLSSRRSPNIVLGWPLEKTLLLMA